MTLSDIAALFKTFPLLAPDSYDGGCAIEDMMTALFSEVVRPRSEQYFPDLLDRNRVSLHAAVASEYGGLFILAVDDEPVAVLLRTENNDDSDDRYRPYVVNQEAYAKVATEMAIVDAKKRIESMGVEGDMPVNKLKRLRIHFLGTESTMFAIREPNESYRFADVLKAHRGYFVDSTGTVHALQAIGAFEGDDMVKITLADGQELMAEACQLMFELVPGQGNIENALKSYEDDPHWGVHEAIRHGLMVSVLMQRRYCWSTRMVLIEFETEAEFERFCTTYPIGLTTENMQRGVFVFEELGFTARRVHA